jgi:hypothetical protein
MTIRRSSPLAGSLVIACVLLAGCGSSTSSTTASTAATQSAPSSGAGTSSAPLTGASVTEGIELCKKEIAAQKSLPASAKAKLEAVCQKASKGETAAVKKAAQEVCEEVIKGSPLPSSSAKEQALAACRAK